MKSLSFLPWTLLTLLIIFRENYGSDCDEKNRPKRNINQAQPRMSSEGGNLVFHTGSTKNIEFRTGSQGRIKLNEEDLADVFSQIQRNKDEILELKRLTNTPLNLSSEIIQLQTQIVNIEDRLDNLELTFKKACNSNPCQNSGTCINLLDAFFCLCPNNWQGPDCSVDVNECQIYEGTFLGCQNGATCINKPGNYSCICTPETYGQYCTSEFDDCQGGSSLVCGHGVCVDGNREQHNQPNYTCICDDGWMSPPGSLACSADIDECSLPNPPCSVNPPVRCINMRGFYFCDPCPAGYEGDGKVCTLINICSVDNGGCHPLAVCNNVSGTVPNCVCPDGYTGNGYGSNGCFALSTICQTNNPCVNGQCLDTAFGYNCECDPGWIGINCSEKIECGKELTTTYGTINSPGYPGNYPPNRDCYWIVSTNPGLLITFAFGLLSLEHHDNCTQDYLEIRDGLLSQDPLLGKYCSIGLPPPLQTTGPYAWIHFHSNGFDNNRGFHITYITSPACSHEYTTASGMLTSPNYPNNYPDKMVCIYKIHVAKNKQIALNFTYFSLEEDFTCRHDYLEIRNGGYETSPLLGKYCGSSLPPVTISHGNTLWIKFVSDTLSTSTGFSAYWDGTLTGCGAILTSSSGTFMSPNYPMPYYQNMKCYWLLKSSHGNVLEIYFDQFHLESHPSCYFDYLAVYDGSNSNSTMLGKFCGNQIPPTIRSTGNTMYINLNTGYSSNGRGFLAHFKQVCQGIIIANHSQGILESLDYPNNYPPGVYCNWTIQTTTGNTLNYSFQALSTKGGDRCKRDHLKLFDGPNTQSTLIGTFCGDSILPSGVTTNSSLHVVFFSDQIDESTGFQMLWKVNDTTKLLPESKGREEDV